MNFAFICNQNQARSQVLSAYFSKLLPEHKFESFGLIGQENTPLPIVIGNVFSDWGLDPKGRFARNVSVHWDEIQSLDFVIAITSFISGEIESLGFKGEIVNLENEAELLGIEVRDPQLMSREQCAFELAKYLKATFSVLQRYGFIKNTKTIKAFIPGSESSIVSTVKLALNQMSSNSVVLYGDLLAPRRDLLNQFPKAFSKYGYNSLRSEFEFFSIDEHSRLLVPSHTVANPAKVYLDKSWLGLFETIGQNEIILVTPPLRSHSRYIAESYLAGLQASEIQVT